MQLDPDVLSDRQREGRVVRHHVVVGDVQAMGVGHGDALGLGGPNRLDRHEDRAPSPPRSRQRPPPLGRQTEQRLRLRVLNVAHEGRPADLLDAAMGVRRPPGAYRAPPSQRTHQVHDPPRQRLARGAEPGAPPPFHPAVRVHQAPQQLESRVGRRSEVQVGDELLLAPDAPQSERPHGGHEPVGRYAGRALLVGSGRLHDPPVIAAGRAHHVRLGGSLEQSLEHLGVSRRKHHAAARQLAVAEQRTEQPRIDGQQLGVAMSTRWRVDPQPVPVSCRPQHLRDTVRGEDPRFGPGPIVHAPEMIAGAFGGPAVGERHPEDRHHALREDRTHAGAAPIGRRQLVAQAQLTHALPAARGHHLGVERLGLAHTRAAGDQDEVGGLQAGGHLVELDEAGRHAGDVLLALVQPLDVLERVVQDVLDGNRVALEPPLGQAEDAALGVVDQRLDVLLGLERLRDDVRRGLDQLAQDRHVAHDGRVGREIRRHRALLDQQGQRGGPADQRQLIRSA